MIGRKFSYRWKEIIVCALLAGLSQNAIAGAASYHQMLVQFACARSGVKKVEAIGGLIAIPASLKEMKRSNGEIEYVSGFGRGQQPMIDIVIGHHDENLSSRKDDFAQALRITIPIKARSIAFKNVHVKIYEYRFKLPNGKYGYQWQAVITNGSNYLIAISGEPMLWKAILLGYQRLSNISLGLSPADLKIRCWKIKSE